MTRCDLRTFALPLGVNPEFYNRMVLMDAARTIAPNHPMLKGFDDLEQALRTRNPEYF